MSVAEAKDKTEGEAKSQSKNQADSTALLQTPPLGLYVHIPWCARKCPYCDFNSHESGMTSEPAQRQREKDYIAALRADLDADLQLFPQRQLHSIFFGGGTPSLFSPDAIAAILSHAAEHFTWDGDTEVTLEANPGSADIANFRAYRQSGINRLSIGVQSFAETHLKTLGRIHNGQEARQAITAARSAGFDNLNIDLMHGLPGQSAADALSDLRLALEYEPAHLSWYELTIEPNTVFYRQPPRLPDEATLQQQQEEGQALLAAAGYEHYEVSAFCRPGRQSQHNLNYWQFGDYIGLGAGAHGKATAAAAGQVLRTRKHRQPAGYMQHYKSVISNETSGVVAHKAEHAAAPTSLPAECSEVDAASRITEFMLNALRLREGFTVSLFESRTGLSFSEIANKVEYLQSRKLLEWQGQGKQRLAATPQGYRHLNRALEDFLPA